ncbi:type I restriction endonuclease subunit R [Vulgatibacter incomptus]|uniref:Type I restriction-modification system, restriction subunit R n=1 Tax=Vulgatibacter incomptus TaxID=1391653 RepID=A0A0K1PDI6_9BACT|nr:DEAD/DEAH box helicase family protein [Vulgatibacter incomptus]AKU91179.1 Type I restriction-modification system, restriction subunit R [Vulgatibacter incomptus]
MTAKHTEQAFEEAIEHHLVTAGGWRKVPPAAFDRDRALLPAELFAFFEATQTALWAELRAQHGAGLEAAVLDTLCKALDSRGTLDVLRHGLKFFGKKLDCATFKPAHGLNPDVVATYAENRLAVTRQVRFAPSGHKDEDQSIDLMLSLNGLPIATVELKNPLTQQTVQHAIAQYRARDPRHRLLQFKLRALVHFAVDPDHAFMTTRLAGEGTTFLPFNRGAHGGAGNPEHPSGYRTAYLWEEVWQRDSFLDIVGRFLHLAKEEKLRAGKKVEEEKIVFPRYHQLDAVRRLEAAARIDGPGNSYLIQHSAGSGKSNSIAWLAHRLASLHDAKDARVFDSVVVITDRRVLDKQLQDNIYQFEHKQGVVAKIDEHSDQLAKALEGGTPIIITTLQKFPVILERIGGLKGRRYALVVDEAHSSQTGESARKMKQVLAATSLEEAEGLDAAGDEDDSEEKVLAAVMASRGRQRNLSYFAFTATPKAKTLEIFGHRDAEGKPRPFHLYSMRQAIEEGFILDVLKSYTTYKAFYRLVKATENDPRVPKEEATRQLARFMSLHPHNVAQKTEVMVEHFRTKVRHKLGGRAKAMLVTSSRLHAVRYKQAFDAYLKEKGYGDIGVLVAFSGIVKDPASDLEFTEPGMNVDKVGKHISEAGLPGAFDGDDFQILLVANKYQTGFDQPLLHTMYVDKRLSGVQAVQTLSRLNRTAPGKQDTFVLDFVNDTEEIQQSFQPYYEATTVAESAEPQQLYDLAHRLEGAQVFWLSEVEAFCKVFFSPREKQSVQDQAEMNRHLNPGVDRFKALEEATREEFKNALGAFVRLYAFLSQIMPFSDPDLEKLYTFARYFETKLPQDPKKGPLSLDGDVALEYYRLDKLSEGAIALRAAEPGVVFGATEVGTRKAKDDEAQLSEIIGVLNDRFGTEFDQADQILFDQFVAAAKLDDEVVQRAKANPLDNFALAMKGKVEGLMVDRMDQNQEIVTRYLNDSQFQDLAFRLLVKRIYDEIRGEKFAAAGL